MSERETCAWCLKEQGITPQTDSHGICEAHAHAMLANAQRIRAEKAKSKLRD